MSNTFKTRKTRNKNRDKDIIATEKADKALRTEARLNLGITARGHLTEIAKAKIEAYILKHSTD